MEALFSQVLFLMEPPPLRTRPADAPIAAVNKTTDRARRRYKEGPRVDPAHRILKF
jgi:hypothetical protein